MLSSSPLKKIIRNKDIKDSIVQPNIIKADAVVSIDYNHATDIAVDENFEETFNYLKSKYRDRIKGKLTLRGSYFSSFYLIIDFDQQIDRITYIKQ